MEKNRVPLNLNLPAGMVDQIKIQAVKEHRSVSQIAEELFKGYLKPKPKAKPKPKPAGK